VGGRCRRARQVIDDIVRRDGHRAIRSAFARPWRQLTGFDANGWFGPKAQRELSNCYVLLQVQGGEFVRVFPEQRGTLSCDPANLQEVAVDPTTEFKG
jgi:hypothetical protein